MSVGRLHVCVEQFSRYAPPSIGFPAPDDEEADTACRASGAPWPVHPARAPEGRRHIALPISRLSGDTRRREGRHLPSVGEKRRTSFDRRNAGRDEDRVVRVEVHPGGAIGGFEGLDERLLGRAQGGDVGGRERQAGASYPCVSAGTCVGTCSDSPRKVIIACASVLSPDVTDRKSSGARGSEALRGRDRRLRGAGMPRSQAGGPRSDSS